MLHHRRSSRLSKTFRCFLFIVPGLLLGMFVSHTVMAGEALHAVKGKPLANNFILRDIDGKSHSLKQYRGKVVIVNFWATWCPPCRKEMPSMEDAWRELKKQDVMLLGVNVGEDADTVFEFTANYPVTFPLLLDRDSLVVQSYPVIALPTSFVIDPGGRIIYKAVGSRNWSDKVLLAKILALKTASP